jgi:LysM repeat protein
MRFTTAAFALAAFASSVLAHVEMIDPPPFRSKDNKLIDPSTVDFDMNAPLDPKGGNFPCKLYHKDFNLQPAGDSTATWAAGSPQTLTLLGEATHNGGSCQLSLSFDEGKTFRVIKSIEGGCAGNGNKFDFKVPAEAKSGKVIFAWTWFNHTGNREMYMNCAAVDITGNGSSTLEDRPEIFKANIGGECSVKEDVDVQFPNPGPDLEVISTESLGPPDCKPTSSSPPEEPTSSSQPEEPTSSSPPDESTTNPDSTGPIDSYESAEPTTTPTSVPSGTSQAPPSTTTGGIGPVYVVQEGDICLGIAAQQGVSLDTLFKLNPAINEACTNLKPGQVLTLRRRSRIMRDLY